MTLPMSIERLSKIIGFECGMCGLTFESLPKNIKKSKGKMICDLCKTHLDQKNKGAILKWT